MTIEGQMPRYKCHKEVWALKIAEMSLPMLDGSMLLTFHEPGYAPLLVDKDYVRKHSPKRDGYYVVYDDGYKSFSPAKAFEEGYTRI
jgi:hypothetical protein